VKPDAGVEKLTDGELADLADHTSSFASPIAMARRCLSNAFQIRSHTEAISQAFVDLFEGRYDRMILVTPPQVGKSWVAGIWAPFWWLCNRPADRLAVVSYGLSLAVSRGRAVRRLVNEHGARYGIALAGDSRAVNDWHLAGTDGGLRCVGIGGGLTGNPVDGCLIIDDPHKDRAEADSHAKREAVHDWYSSTGLSRLAPGTPAVIVQTRWHEDDLAGRRLAEEGTIEEGGRWKLLHMPALAGPHDSLGRAPGEPLEHPRIRRGDVERALAHWYDKRATSSPRDWGALYMGDPKPPEGALVSRALMTRQTHHGPLPAPRRVGVAVDPSGGGRDAAGIIGGHTDAGGRLFWTHDRTAVMASDQWAQAACVLAADIDADRIVVEANYGGDQTTALIRFAWRELLRAWPEEHPGEPNPYDRPMPFLVAVHSRRGKLLRAEPVAGFLGQDRIRLAPGMPELINEWTSWQPDSPDSPGRIDASVHLAYALVKALPAGNVVSSAAGVAKTGRRGTGEPGAGPVGARIPRGPRPKMPGRGPGPIG